MRRIILLTSLLTLLILPVRGVDITAPVVPDSGRDLMPYETDSFGEGLWEIVLEALEVLKPDLAEGLKVCGQIIGVVLLLSILKSMHKSTRRIADMVGTIVICTIMLTATNSMVNLGTVTIAEISEYGKLLLPVMATALATQGGVTASASLYTGTAIFNAVLSTVVSKILIPFIFVYLSVSVTNCAMEDDLLKRLCDLIKGIATWCLKAVLYFFTGYISITGVISGTTDAAALKAAKLAISGAVPVVGGILSDASETVLVSAGVVKNAAGIYGLLAILAVTIGPFLKIGLHYMLLKGATAVSGIIGPGKITGIIQAFSTAMGLLLAMTGTVCLLLLISTVCFLRGVG